jgi:hypothetical protein
MQQITLTVDTRSITEEIEEAGKLLTEFPDVAPEFGERLLGALDAGLKGGSVETVSAAGTTELRIRVDLSDGFHELVAALRARNIKRRVRV